MQMHALSNGLYCILTPDSSTYKICDTEGRFVNNKDYIAISEISSYVIMCHDASSIDIIDFKGNIVNTHKISGIDNVVLKKPLILSVFTENGKCLIDEYGQYLIPPSHQYMNFTIPNHNYPNFIQVRDKYSLKIGLYDTRTSQFVIPINYTSIRVISDKYIEYSDGYSTNIFYGS